MTIQSKSVVDQKAILAARHGLVPVRERAWLGGFGNMLRKELGQWWGTRTWWVQTLIWVLILNGITTIVAVTEATLPEGKLTEVVQTFLGISVSIVGIGAVIVTQGAIVGEKQMGTAAWVMSKPASRSAFVLAKLIAYGIGFWATAVLIPSTIFVFTMGALVPAPLPLATFLAGMAVAALGQLFYLTLTLMLGTFFNSRGPVAGIGIAFIMIGLMLKGLIPQQILILTPWPLADLAGPLAMGMELPSIWIVPVLATAFWIIVMTIAALWRFGREEF
jgi:ABC-2 type transport system permease protein